MPVPIRPIDDRDRGYSAKDSSYTMMDLDVLSKAFDSAGMPVKKADKFVQASDEDASVLFDLWKRSEVVKDSDDACSKQYAIPAGFSNDNIMRLKTSNFIAGDMSVIKFLPRAVGVIKTMVLAEENEFGRRATQKPYNLILAEMKKKFSGGPRLALGGAVTAGAVGISPQDGLDLNEHLKTAQVRNISEGDIPPQKLSGLNRTPYRRSDRLHYEDDRSDKEYVVRVFDHRDGTYSAIAFNGRTGRGLTAQPKYYGRSLDAANIIADEAIRAKERKGYSRVYSGIPPTMAPGEDWTRRPSQTPHGDALGDLEEAAGVESPRRESRPAPMVPQPDFSAPRAAPMRPSKRRTGDSLPGEMEEAAKQVSKKPAAKTEPAPYKLTEEDLLKIINAPTGVTLDEPETDI